MDVDQGRVVKGTKFIDIRDAGDPVELAAYYDQHGADELVFLDITATSDKRATVVDLARRGGGGGVVPFHPRRGRPTRCSSRSRSAAASGRSRMPRRCSTPAPTRWRSTPPPSPGRR